MADRFLQRWLSALINADVVGYSRLMADDEVATVRALTACRQRIAALIAEKGGRLVDFVGDNLLAEFPNTLDAVQCAQQIHEKLAELNTSVSDERRLQFRIGIHLGDVMSDGERLYGDGVNIAARIQALADPGSTCVSDLVYRQVHGKLDFGFVDLGKQHLKNISDPVQVLRIEPTDDALQRAVGAKSDVKTPALPLPAKPSLAVLPFANLSAGYERDDFTHGLTLDIIAALVQIPGLLLISDVTTFNYKSSLFSIRDIGRQLGVGHVLDGGVRRSGDRVRITARLTETAESRQVWVRRFDRKLDDMFAVQDEITNEIVTAMDVELVSGQQALTIRQALHNPLAIESYYKGWGALFSSSPDSLHVAQKMFEETIRLEPESSLGYALAAWAYWFELIQKEGKTEPRVRQRAIQLADQALQRKDITGMPEMVMAKIHLHNKEHAKALKASEKAVLARPSCDASYALKANILNYLGRPEQAVDLAHYAMRLAPVFPPYYPAVLAASYYGSGKFEEAVAAAEIALQVDPENIDALVTAAANQALGRSAEAGAAVEKIRKARPDFNLQTFAHRQPYKNPQDLDRLVGRLKKAGL
jgi:TolB-like protein/tetratricopeptide (TPR) repeat protein